MMKRLSIYIIILFLVSCQTFGPKKKIRRVSRGPLPLHNPQEIQSDISYYKQRSPGASRLQQSGVIPRSQASNAVDGRALRESDERRKGGSLWSNNSKNNYFFLSDDSKNIGDIIYINLKEDLRAMLKQNTKRKSYFYKPRTPAGSRVRGAKSAVKQNASKPKPTAKKTSNSNKAKRPKKSLKKNTYIAARVIDRLGNGTLLVEGHKLVDVNRTVREILVSGYVKESDINSRDEVDSRKMADLNIDYAVVRKK